MQTKLIEFLDHVLDKLCMTPAAVSGLILLLFLPYIPPFNQDYLLRWLIAGILMAAQAIAFDFTAGFINIVNFGFYAFVGFGGYVSVLLVQHLGIHPLVGMFAAGFAASILGFMLGLLTLRLRGIFAAVVAWFLGLALMGLATQMVWLTRGVLGLRAQQMFDTTSNLPYYYMIIGMMVIIYLVTKWIVRSDIGLAFRAIGQNMDAAKTSGINPVFYRVSNFTISCAFAGWLGGFYAHFYRILTPDVLLTSKTIEVLVVAYIGGRASLWGGAVAAIPFVFAMELIRSYFSNLPGINLIIYGIFLILVMFYYPGGLAGIYEEYVAGSKIWFLCGSRDTSDF